MNAGDTSWMLVSAALVLFMTPGLALFYGGMDRTRNVLNMLMMNFWCLLIIPVLWVLFGFSIAQVPFDNDIIGNFDAAFLRGLPITGEDGGSALLTVAFLGMFAVITPALISGAVADRMKFSAWAIFAPVWMLLVFCPVFKWVYGGWLGIEIPNVRAAIWMMRALVVNNVLARREGTVLFVPVHPSEDPGGEQVARRLARVWQLARARNLLS